MTEKPKLKNNQSKYKIHFLNPENNHSLFLDFTDKDLPFKPDKPTLILVIENTYFLFRYQNRNEYFYKRVEGEQVGVTQEEIDIDWYMILDWNYINTTPDPYDE